MITLRPPARATIDASIAAQRPLPFTYAAVGATATTPPPGFDVDHMRVAVGRGRHAFEIAYAALREWKQFDLGWVGAEPRDTPLVPGAVIAVWARKFGLTWINACRIVNVIDDEVAAVRRFGFAYGTLPGHVESGEERFLVEWNRESDEVTYDILAFSRPRHWAVRLGYPMMRRSQRRFAAESAAVMQRTVQQALGAATA